MCKTIKNANNITEVILMFQDSQKMRNNRQEMKQIQQKQKLQKMQNKLITQDQLLGLMTILKDSVDSFNEKCPNVEFINEWCMYRHLRSIGVPRRFGWFSWLGLSNLIRRKKNLTTLGVVIDILEPYIPFRLTEENFELFMETLAQPENPFFAHKARLDFVVALRNISSPTEWEHTISVCETIRSLKEGCMLSS